MIEMSRIGSFNQDKTKHEPIFFNFAAISQLSSFASKDTMTEQSFSIFSSSSEREFDSIARTEEEDE
jgi:uncharacterized membrane protein YfhO